MENAPLISVIVPMYNAEKYLGDSTAFSRSRSKILKL